MGENFDVDLSKNLLEMKFMKKTKEQVLKKRDDAEGQAMYSKQISDKMRKSDGDIIFRQASISNCKNLVEGRLSFGGMNRVVEKLMESDYNKKYFDAEKRKEKDVSDEQMAKEYSTVVDTLNKKFRPKKQRNQKFQKPSTTEPLV
ncbi:unnamed protein product [Ceutorhynchus assimilis]|uniref:M-phase phosphoprotein 6 n=1 Tax=Ceutorhynchus assimilis TaxID=467358 RepID=A0A9N9MZK6_9CUCU|nr:unnamed protein product [Ceutorhynchus assimilis]